MYILDELAQLILASSLRQADVVLQRLINAAPADRLAKALTALGSLVKTIHILHYIHDAPPGAPSTCPATRPKTR
jgi:TnpA family transposase